MDLQGGADQNADHELIKMLIARPSYFGTFVVGYSVKLGFESWTTGKALGMISGEGQKVKVRNKNTSMATNYRLGL